MKGKLVYVIGASGSGKDTLLKNVRKYANRENLPVLFAHRYITRPVDAEGEHHIPLSKSEFMYRSKMGFFALSWECYSRHYGIGIEINEWLKSNSIVIVNGSREYLFKAIKRYPNLQAVLIEVSIENIKKRLLKRGRENIQEMEERLNRASKFNIEHEGLIKIYNNRTEQDTLDQFIKVLSKMLFLDEVKI